MQLWNILRQSRPFQYWRYACWSLAYTMWTFSRSEGPWTKQRTFFQPFERATLHTDPCRPQISFFFFSKVLFCAIFVPAFKKHSIVSRIACYAWPVWVYFAFILLWKINFPNEISKRNLGRLLCEKKIYSATIQILPNFVRFLNYIELFWEKVAFLFFQGREMSRVYIYIYILIITGVQVSWVIIDRLLRQCCFVWSEIVGPHSSGNFNDWPLKLKAGSKIWVVVIGMR